MINYYAVLGVPPASTHAQVKARYRDLARTMHPDLYLGDEGAATFSAITEAGSVLCDAERRREYDARLALLMDPCPKCKGRGCHYIQMSFTDVETIRCKECKGEGYAAR